MGVVAAGGLLALTQAAGAIARPVTGVLSDRLFQGKRKEIFMFMAVTALLMVFILGLFGSYLSWMLYPVLFFLGTGAIGFGGIYITLLSEFGGRHGAGKAVGLGGMLVMVGSALGPTVFGRIVDISGSYRLAWLSLAIVSALCLGCLLFVNEEKKKI
jgi:MFS family permease